MSAEVELAVSAGVRDTTGTARPSRRTRTRAALLAAGHKLLAERAIAEVAIDDIVQTAGVAKGSFYNHFTDKDDFARSIREDFRIELEDIVGRVNANVEDPARRVARGFAVYLRFVLAAEDRARVMWRVSTDAVSTRNPLNRGLTTDIAEGLRSGRFTAPSVEAAVLYVLGIGQIALMRATEEPNSALMLPLAQQLLALMLRGLGLQSDAAESISASTLHDIFSTDLAGRPA